MVSRKNFVFDLDGTLCNCAHRLHFIEKKPKRWDLFIKGIEDDTPYDDVVFLAQTFKDLGHNIIICTGREATGKDATVDWLIKHRVQFDGLYMRGIRDYRPDYVVKPELGNTIQTDFGKIFMVFEDRTQVVDAWREMGIRCMQVTNGNY